MSVDFIKDQKIEFKKNEYPYFYYFENKMDWHYKKDTADILHEIYKKDVQIGRYDVRDGLFIRSKVLLKSKHKLSIDDYRIKDLFISSDKQDYNTVMSPIISNSISFE